MHSILLERGSLAATFDIASFPAGRAPAIVGRYVRDAIPVAGVQLDPPRLIVAPRPFSPLARVFARHLVGEEIRTRWEFVSWPVHSISLAVLHLALDRIPLGLILFGRPDSDAFLRALLQAGCVDLIPAPGTVPSPVIALSRVPVPTGSLSLFLNGGNNGD